MHLSVGNTVSLTSFCGDLEPKQLFVGDTKPTTNKENRKYGLDRVDTIKTQDWSPIYLPVDWHFLKAQHRMKKPFQDITLSRYRP